MNGFLLIILEALFGALVLSTLLKQVERYRSYKSAAKHGCKPVRILHRTGWFSKLRNEREVLRAYQSGTRNKQLQDQHSSFGLTFRTHETSQIFTIDPENVKAVLGGRFTDWGVEPIRLQAFMPLMGRGTLTTDGNFWKHARGLCQTNLNWIAKYRNRDLSYYNRSIEALIKMIPTDGSTMDMSWPFNQYMIDSSTIYILGESIGSLLPDAEGEVGRKFLRAFFDGIEQCGQRNEAWQLTDMFVGNEFSNQCKIVHEVVDKLVQRALDEARKLDGKIPAEGSLLSMWAMSSQDPREIRNQILNVLMAAFDTTAITLTHCVFHLARHPKCYSELRKEAIALNMEGLTGDSIRNLKYLRAVVDETLRLNTPATFNSRVALTDIILPRGGGADGCSPVFVSKGAVVSTSIYCIQRNPEVFGSDANSFRPERWLDIQPSNWDYMPFSAGPRTCPGAKLALPQVSYALVNLARTFTRLENRDPTWELVEQYKVATSSRNGAKVAWYID